MTEEISKEQKLQENREKRKKLAQSFREKNIKEIENNPGARVVTLDLDEDYQLYLFSKYFHVKFSVLDHKFFNMSAAEKELYMQIKNGVSDIFLEFHNYADMLAKNFKDIMPYPPYIKTEFIKKKLQEKGVPVEDAIQDIGGENPETKKQKKDILS